jgi:hypothetical protein
VGFELRRHEARHSSAAGTPRAALPVPADHHRAPAARRRPAGRRTRPSPALRECAALQESRKRSSRSAADVSSCRVSLQNGDCEKGVRNPIGLPRCHYCLIHGFL